MEFEFIKGHDDATSTYKVNLDKMYTVRDLVEEVLTHEDEWGYIGIKTSRSKGTFGDPCGQFKHGKDISVFEHLEDYLDDEVTSVVANGGYTRMDYLISV